MTIEGLIATKTIERSMKGDDFYQFFKTELVSKLRKSHVIIMDNLNIHKMQGIEELVIQVGARIEYLPPYTPEFNPIEMLWSVLKAFVRLFPSWGSESLEKLIKIGICLIQKPFFINWFAKCCYCANY